jgi:kanamycin kinase
MSFPSSPTPVPAVVRRFAAGRAVRAVWINGDGGVTFRLGSGVSGGEYVKVARSETADLAGESSRLLWAARYVTVPQVLGFGPDDGLGEGIPGDLAWLRTRALPGLSAVHPRWLASPEAAVRAIGAGLRTLHDRLPVRACPFDWSAAGRLARLTPARRRGLEQPPLVDRLVVCHGDACAPNTLIGDDGRCVGHVDLGDLGLADRWADLAVATLSLSWNYPGRSWDGEFFAAYGVEPDAARIDYYRRLWNAEGAGSR